MTEPDKPLPPGTTDAQASSDTAPRHASLPQVFGAVFWSFFGVRKGKHMQQDAVTIRPVQVIVVGVFLAAVIVFVLLALVKYITRNAP